MTAEAHARLGPSNHRWPHCPGSVREEEQYPDIPGDAAIDGTGSHLLLELCLTEGKPAHHFDGQVIGVNHEDKPSGWFVEADRIERVQMCLDYVSRRIKELKGQFPDCVIDVLSESKSDPGGAFGRSDWWGTTDITLIARKGNEIFFVEVIDYKDGREYVSEKWNGQLVDYLFGKMRPFIASGPELVRPFRPENVYGCRMTIVQPKTNPVIRYICSTRPDDFVTVQAVITFAEDRSSAAAATDKPDAPLNPGNHCRWCKANPTRGGHCTAMTDRSLKTVGSMSNDLSISQDQSLFEYISKAVADPKSLTEEQLADLADAEAGMQAAFEAVKNEIESRISQGINVPGYAMLPGKGSNKWNEDEEKIVKKLKSCRLKKDQIYVSKLVSPAQMKEIADLTDEQKERLWKELVTYVAGNKTLKKVARTEALPDFSGEANTAELMFGDVANPKSNDISFF